MQAGPIVIFVAHFLYLVPHYYLLNALVVGGRRHEEGVLRAAFLQSHVVATLLEMAWSAFHPETLKPTLCAAFTILSCVLHAIQLAFAFQAQSDVYHLTLAVPLQCAATSALIPLSQFGQNFTLRQGRSPARYRMLGWLAGVFLAVLVLLRPEVANLSVAVLSTSVPAGIGAIAIMLDPEPHDHDHEAGTARQAGVKKIDKMQRVSLSQAGAFIGLSCLTGTIGEALIDMATTLAIRRSLLAGEKDMALTNQAAVFASMLLAYVLETRPGGGAEEYGQAFILIWSLCQFFRGAALHLLEVGGASVLLLAAFVFVDKFTGPLGLAALDTALLQILEGGGRELSGSSVPARLLWTVHTATSRVERPLCQLILLTFSWVPVQLLGICLTLTTSAGVMFVLRKKACPPKGPLKQD
eukprot:TRINITY_DN47374_c0_g1_i1.p1 TRINITY_DN47374_c0_g1~~TRINITY_DN47374_c0_g1_i1.p1  ORF type:complete len:411 (-),score=33.52 TRINITY_DN47374_c0_g1_i1:23-1255(-)